MARRCPGKKVEKNFQIFSLSKIDFFFDFLAYNNPRPPMCAHKKNQPNRSYRLAGYRQHIYIQMSCIIIIYECLLLYRLYISWTGHLIDRTFHRYYTFHGRDIS